MKNLSLALILILLFNPGCKKNSNNPVVPDNSNGWSQTGFPSLDGGLVTSGTNLFAGNHPSGVFRSSDGGSSWTPVDSGLNGIGVTSLAVSGADLFAGTASMGIFRSNDLGASWIAVDSELLASNQYFLEVLCLCSKGTNLFAGTGGTGVALSTNNGASWTWTNTGLYSGTIVYAVISQAADVFISTNFGIYRSSDDGATWTSVNGTLHDFFSIVSDGTNLFAGGQETGLYISTDKGASWIPRNGGSTILPTINALVASDSNIFVGTDAGLFLSTNTGASWTDISKGLPSNVVEALVVCDKYLYAEISTKIDGTFSESVWRRPL
ncbi:MAG TPA: hypothetical protein VMF88_15385 [Bacteroidota bacterium]|nr:hypothetical protein [Bacteroidota bacterium]